jgi:hypothetical protein
VACLSTALCALKTLIDMVLYFLETVIDVAVSFLKTAVPPDARFHRLSAPAPPLVLERTQLRGQKILHYGADFFNHARDLNGTKVFSPNVNSLPTP